MKLRDDRGASSGGALMTAVLFIVVAGLIFGFLKISGISSFEDFKNYFRSASNIVNEKVNDCVHGGEENPGQLEIKCPDTDNNLNGNTKGPGSDYTPPTDWGDIDTKTQTPEEIQYDEISVSLEKLKDIPILDEVSELPKISMNDWPHWSVDSDNCSTRDKILIDRGSDPVVDKPCKIISGSWISVFDDTVIDESQNVYLSYNVPLSYINYYAKRDLTPNEKEEIANDPDNISLVSQSIYTEKEGKSISQWLPTNGQCEYAENWVKVLDKYSVMTTENDSKTLKDTLENCLKSIQF